MYCSHFGLHRPPFNNTPDPTFYFGTPEHEEALATLQYGVFQRKGFSLVTGEVGAGKTLIGRMFLRQVDRSASVAVISHTNLNGRQLLAAICREFEIETPPEATNLELTERLQNFLLEQFAQDRFAVVLLDEAQNLPDESFEELRMLGNLEADDAKLLQICILGQPELRERFRQPNLRQIDQRLFRRFHLSALSRINTEAYIKHRLKVAGCPREDLFTRGAIDRVFVASQGIPRLINKICDNALLTAYGDNADQVTAVMVDQSVEPELVPSSGDGGPVVDNETEAAAAVGVQAGPCVDEEKTPSAAPIGSVNHSDEAGRAIDRGGRTAPAANDAGLKAAVRATAKATDRLAERQAATERELKAALGRMTEAWRKAREDADRQRREIQQSLDDAIGQYHALEARFAELASSSASQDDVKQIRRVHQAESDRLVAEIARQGQEFKRLLAEAEDRWEETRSRISSVNPECGGYEAVAAIQSEFDAQIQGLVGRLDGYRQHIGQLAEVLRAHCVQAQGDLQAVRDAQAQTETKLAEAKQALNARMDSHEERISTLDRRVSQHLSAVTEAIGSLEKKALTGGDLDRMRREQAGSLGEVLNLIRVQGDELAEFKTGIIRRCDKDSGELQSVVSQIGQRVDTQTARLDGLHGRVSDFLTAMDSRFNELGERFAERSEVEAGLAELRRSHEVHAAEVSSQIEANRGAVKQLVDDVADRFRQAQERLAGLADASAGKTDLDELRSRQEQESQSLSERLEAQKLAMEAQFEQTIGRLLETQERIEALAGTAARAEDLEQFQRRQAEEQKQALDMFGAQRREIESLAEATTSRCDEIVARLDEVRTRHEVILREQESALADLRRSHEAHAAEVVRRIETGRDTVKKLVGNVVERFRQAHQRLEEIAATSAGKDEVNELRSRHEQDSRSLIERLEGQKLAMEAQFDRVLWRLQETRTHLNQLSSDAARAEDFEQFRRQQSEDQDKVLAILGTQRRDLETLAEATNHRCDQITTRLDAIPADVATTSQIEAVRGEYSEQLNKVLADLENRRAQLEQSIHSVAEYCDRTNSAVSALAAEAATVQDVAELRSDQGQKFDELRQRLTEQEQTQVNRMHLLTRKVKDHAQRVSELEEQNRRPVRLELAPKAGTELGRIVEAANQQHLCLSDAVERAGAIASHLHDASSHVQEVMKCWADNADKVDEQSRHLRASAETAARILDAMRKCHSALDRKLNSQRWQHELARGEAVAQKLEKASTQGQAVVKQLTAVLRDFDRCQESADDFASRTKQTQQTVQDMTRQAQQVVQQLSRLLGEASSVGTKFDQNLNRRKQMLNAVAQNTARLMELIDSARHADETGKPSARGDARKQDGRKADKTGRAITDVEWPTIRVRPAHVG